MDYLKFIVLNQKEVSISIQIVNIHTCDNLMMAMSDDRGMPANTQSTQLRTLIFECPKNKNV